MEALTRRCRPKRQPDRIHPTAILDYHLNSKPAEPVTLEVFDSAGKSVRRYSSDDQALSLTRCTRAHLSDLGDLSKHATLSARVLGDAGTVHSEANRPRQDVYAAADGEDGPALQDAGYRADAALHAGDNLSRLNGELVSILEILEGSDQTPTTQAAAAVADVRKSLDILLVQWKELQKALAANARE